MFEHVTAAAAAVQGTLGSFVLSLIGAGLGGLKTVAGDRPSLSLCFKAAAAEVTQDQDGDLNAVSAAAQAALSSTPRSAAAAGAALVRQAKAMLSHAPFSCLTGFFTVNNAVKPHLDINDRWNSLIVWQGAGKGSDQTMAWFGLWSCLLALPVVSGLHLYVRTPRVVHGTSWRHHSFKTEAPTDADAKNPAPVLVGMALTTRCSDLQWLDKNAPARFARGSAGS